MKINEATGLYENYGLWHVPLWQTKSFKITVAALGFVVMCLIILFLIRRYLLYRKKKKLLSWEQALFDLNQLELNQQVSLDHGKEFYAALSEIVKKYLFARYNYDVLGKTDSELISYLEKNHDGNDLQKEIKDLFQGSGIVKFANAKAVQEQIDRDCQSAIAIIKKTIPQKK